MNSSYANRNDEEKDNTKDIIPVEYAGFASLKGSSKQRK